MTTKPEFSTRRELETLYFARHAEATGIVERIMEELGDLPTPDRADWADCGSLGYVVQLLREVLAHMESGRNSR